MDTDDEYAAHPAAAIFPLLEGTEFEALCVDIAQNGLREAIVRVRDGASSRWLVLDGRNRLRACQARGVTPVWKTYEGADLAEYVVSANLRRRHLNESQRGMVAAKLATLIRGTNRFSLCKKVDVSIDTSTNAGGQATPSSAPSKAAAAALLNVSVASVNRARRVLAHGIPALQAKVEQGAVSLNAADTISELEPAEQATRLEGQRPRVRASRPRMQDRRLEQQIAERDERIRELLEGPERLMPSAIARRLGIPVNYIQAAKNRLGLRPPRDTNPLRKFTDSVLEFGDAWESALLRVPELLEWPDIMPEHRTAAIAALERLISLSRQLRNAIKKEPTPEVAKVSACSTTKK